MNYKIDYEINIKQGLMGAIFLKWINENKMYLRKNESKKLEFVFNDNIVIDDETEKQLYKILKLASDNSNNIEVNKFKNFINKYYSVIDGFFDNIMEREFKKIRNNGLITKNLNDNYINLNEVAKEEAYKLLGLKKYLLDFSNMSSKEYIDVKLWQEYLMFANLLGIADKVEKKFKQLYPNLINYMEYNLVLRNIANSSCNIYQSKRRSAIAQKTSYNSSGGYSTGAGGRSFSGGGGSAGGSSGGGFR